MQAKLTFMHTYLEIGSILEGGGGGGGIKLVLLLQKILPLKYLKE